MAYRVFISHATADTWIARQIDRRIREFDGGQTFLDVNDVEKGDDIEQAVFGALRDSRELIALLTPWSVDRNWVWTEIGAARVLEKRLVVVLYQVTLEQLEAGRGATFLRAKNTVAINALDDYLEELKRRIGECGHG
jgi:hypothetical protein